MSIRFLPFRKIADLGSDADLNRVVELALARFGCVDVVINAAVHYAFGHIAESPRLLAGLEAQFNLNALVPLKLAAKVARDFSPVGEIATWKASG